MDPQSEVDKQQQEIADSVTQLRELFFKEHAASIEKGSYDERDVERVRTDDEYLSCFIRSFYHDSNMDVVLTKLDTVLTFRKTIGLNDLTLESFPADFEERQVLYWHGVDKENRKILLVKVARHKKGVDTEEMKRFVAWKLEQHHQQQLGVRIVVIYDFTDAGIMNMDLDLVRFIITCLTTYFPGILHLAFLFEMPWLLSSIWKVIRGWLTPQQRNRTLLVNKAELSEYIAADELEPHMHHVNTATQ